uniref:Plant heme peroxidase family profile domain-containing protein n=1 Tax=Lotharella globosa TaxID=91324 RepID=A0A6U3B5R8_9EUKA|mmetsp:Transcript_28457/g.55386  ORF Transcript_28457/g.55386 Transcript_28457/m.55386 type:complete len:296 (+) Transcript_28457:53-940(+)
MHSAALLLVFATATALNYDAVRGDITDLIREKDCGPILIRLSWHDAGTWDASSQTGGPRGAMRFESGESKHGANNGLDIARDLLEPLKKKYHEISYADLWSLAGVVAVEEMGGPVVSWRPGRIDASGAEDSVEEGRLPDAQLGCPHLRDVFHRMALSDQEIVALSGAHTVGAMHADRSGHEGPWTKRPTHFDNQYFKDLVEKKWVNVDAGKLGGSPGNVVFVEEGEPLVSGMPIMLPTDVDMLNDSQMRVWVDTYAASKERFFQDFSSAFTKLQELGVPAFHGIVNPHGTLKEEL